MLSDVFTSQLGALLVEVKLVTYLLRSMIGVQMPFTFEIGGLVESIVIGESGVQVSTNGCFYLGWRPQVELAFDAF